LLFRSGLIRAKQNPLREIVCDSFGEAGLPAVARTKADRPRNFFCVFCALLRLSVLRYRHYNQPMSAFPVSPEKEAQLARRMAELGVNEADIEESFVRSGGHGGQNVNKTSTCVMLVHRPTGLQVKCQETRQQGLNRYIARRLLLDKIEERQRGFVAAKRAEIERIRRQKRKRSRRAKEKMLANKSHHADKKDLRRRVERE
jgi:peptide chain release factor